MKIKGMNPVSGGNDHLPNNENPNRADPKLFPTAEELIERKFGNK